MQRLMLIGAGQARWEDTPEPELPGPGGAIVAPVAAAACDLTVAMLAGR